VKNLFCVDEMGARVLRELRKILIVGVYEGMERMEVEDVRRIAGH
jgi:hypothetical protein